MIRWLAMSTPECRPVIVGVAQLVQRDVDLAEALDPLTMLVQIAREAADECGAGARALAALDTIAVVPVAGWRTENPPRALGAALSARPSREIVCGVGGEFPIAMFNELASSIATGRSQVALMAGCNNMKTLRRSGPGSTWCFRIRRPPRLPHPPNFRCSTHRRSWRTLQP